MEEEILLSMNNLTTQKLEYETNTTEVYNELKILNLEKIKINEEIIKLKSSKLELNLIQKNEAKDEYLKSLTEKDPEIKRLQYWKTHSTVEVTKYQTKIEKIKYQYSIWYNEMNVLRQGVDIGYPGSEVGKDVRDFIYSLGVYKK